MKNVLKKYSVGQMSSNSILYYSLMTWYVCSQIKNEKYNIYSKNTQLSAAMFDFYFSVKLLNKSYNVFITVIFLLLMI